MTSEEWSPIRAAIAMSTLAEVYRKLTLATEEFTSPFIFLAVRFREFQD